MEPGNTSATSLAPPERVLSAVPKGLSRDALSGCHLYLSLAEDNAIATVLDPAENRFVGGEKYRFPKGNLDQVLQQIATESPLFQGDFAKVGMTWFNRWSTLVPLALYDAEAERSYLDFNLDLPESCHVRTDVLQDQDICHVYALPNGLEASLQARFANGRLIHHTTASLETRLLLSRNADREQVYLHFLESYIEIVVCAGRDLRFYNTFPYSTPEDVAYFLLFVCEQLRIPPAEVKPIFSGEVQKSERVFSLIKPYVGDLQFADRPAEYHYGEELARWPSYYFFHPFHLVLCV